MTNLRKRNDLSIGLIIIAIYIIFNILTTKASISHTKTPSRYGEDGIFHYHGIASIITNNKYRIISAHLRIDIIDQDDKIITTQEYDIKENATISYNIPVDNWNPKGTQFTITKVRINYLPDLLISLFLLFTGVSFLIYNKQDKKLYEKKDIYA